jgi:AhpD family alkylhydroperoxidase
MEGIDMTTINLARQMQRFMAITLLLANCGIILAPTVTSAADTASSAAAIAEMKATLGGVPAELQVYPQSARAAGWAMMKSTDLNENTALPAKTRELIGLAVAAQIPCQYCVYYHIKAATAAGASQEEIREAVHQASMTRHWSTILYGNQYDLDLYKSEIDAAFK